MPTLVFKPAVLGLYTIFGPGAPWPPSPQALAGEVDLPDGCELLLLVQEGDPDHPFLVGLPPIVKSLITLNLSASGARVLAAQTGLLGLRVSEPMSPETLTALTALTQLEDLDLALTESNVDAATQIGRAHV